MKEEKKAEQKKSKRWPVLMLLLFVIVILGVSFAWLTLSIGSNKVNIIKAGSLSMTLDDETSDGILIQKAIPMSYRQGMETVEYTFTLKNETPSASDYTISLIDENTYVDENNEAITITDATRIEDTKIRYILLKDGEEASSDKSSLLSNTTNRVIDTGTLNGNTEIKYSLRVWIDSKATNEVMDKVFNAKIRIDATQAQPEEVTPVGPFYAFGTPTTASTTDYTTLGKNIFITLGTDNSLGVCINDGGLFCIKNNDYENSTSALKTHFGEENCPSDRSIVNCISGSFICYANSDGDVYCNDLSTNEICHVYSDGRVRCS